jgi:hypothetical protein
MTIEDPIPRQRDPWNKGRLIGQKRPLPLHRPPTIVADALLQRDNQMCRAKASVTRARQFQL